MGKVALRERTGLLAVLLVVVVIAAASAAGYGLRMADHGLPGASVAGQSIAGESVEQVRASIEQRARDLAVVVTMDDQEYRAPLSALGVRVDAQATVDQAFAANGSVAARFTAIVRGRDTPAVVTVDQDAQKAYLDDLAARHGATARDASFSFSTGEGIFAVTPGEKGRGYDMSSVADAASRAGCSLTGQSLALTLTEVEPAVTTEQARAGADAANALIAPDVSVTADDGTVITATAADKAAWVSTTDQDGRLADPGIDRARVAEWVSSAAAGTNADPVNGSRLVNSSGDVLRVTALSADGRSVNNADAIARQLADALDAGRSYSGVFTYDAVEAQNTDKVIADGAENLPYQAAPGERWLDVDLGSDTVTAYIGADAQATMLMVPGRPGMETVTGTYHVYLKYESQTMRGTNEDGTAWTAPGVEWVTYFYGSYALHAAPWQPSFGWDGPGGSHGCVNMSTSDAQYVFAFAPVGTAVVSHY
ncbi:L,D-transpeptidase family protein [uncultured Propionibacterium sp.]|uniref:L,D-transpeptidase family protein n=1 Tax=uncultured Propionibacterium sp. TaxID=218066 RepID=UPI00292FD0FE|nr:L,D-transpeptidase family protein [uncultured Propionibacterium sp.]